MCLQQVQWRTELYRWQFVYDVVTLSACSFRIAYQHVMQHTYIHMLHWQTHTLMYAKLIAQTSEMKKKCSLCHLDVCVRVRELFFRSQLALFSTYIFNNESRCFKIQIVKQDTATPIETYFDERWENKNQSRRRPIFFCKIIYFLAKKNLVNVLSSNYL